MKNKNQRDNKRDGNKSATAGTEGTEGESKRGGQSPSDGGSSVSLKNGDAPVRGIQPVPELGGGAVMRPAELGSRLPSGLPSGVDETDWRRRLMRNEQLLNALHADVQAIQRGQSAVVSTMRRMSEQMTMLMQSSRTGNSGPFSSLNQQRGQGGAADFPEIQDGVVSPNSAAPTPLTAGSDLAASAP